MGLPGRAVAVAMAGSTLLLAAGCGGSGSQQAASTASKPTTEPPLSPALFKYDATASLHYEGAGRVNHGYPIAIHDVSYATPGGGRVLGYLALPPGKDRVPAVIYVHGSGGDRRELLLPATWFAGRRAVAMTITLPSTRGRPTVTGLTAKETLEHERQVFVTDIVAVRRAVDLLQGLPQVDRSRIGLVGWSLGASIAAVLAGSEPRIRAFVLMSGGANPISSYVSGAPATLRPLMQRVLTTIDPIHWVARARPGTILIQDGRKDTVVPHAALVTLAEAAPKGTTIRWYNADHDLSAAAYRNQIDWLVRKLRVRGPNVPGAKTGP